MLLGVPKETKVHEYRVGMTPASVREVVAHGHEVVIETGAGVGINANDGQYAAAGARIAERLAARIAGIENEPHGEVWKVDLIVRGSVAPAPAMAAAN